MAKSIKVALSGSGFRLPAHIGALAAIEDAGYTVSEIVGTSGGAIVASLYACGMRPADMKKLAMGYDWSSILHLDLWSGIRKGAYCSGSDLFNFLHRYTNGRLFGSLKIPLKIIASDIRSESEVCFSIEQNTLMPIALAARASASIPFVFLPVQYNDYVLVDGGCCNNIPVSHLSPGGLRLGVYLVSNDAVVKGEMGLMQIAGRTIDLILAQSEDARIDASRASTIVRIPTSYAGSLDTKMPVSIRQRLVNDGYNMVSKMLSGLPH